MTDGELVRRAQQGERQTFDELILRRQPIALLLAIRIIGPMTFSFMADLLGKAGVRIESVGVSALENETFFAIVHAQRGEDSFTIDARPSDAIALALRTQSPIFAAAQVMEAAALDVPAEMEVVRGKGPSDIFSIDPEEKERRLKEREKWESMSPEKRREESRSKLLTHLTEAGCLTQSAEPANE